MGYYTIFSLDSEHEDVVVIPDGVSDYLGDDEFFKWRELEGNWYDHIEDMLKVSLANPDVEFRTSGKGEESGDLWQCVFLNGKYKKVKVELVFKPFDEVEWSK